MYFIDPNNIILACNTLKADFFRDIFSCEEVVGKNPTEYLKGEYLALGELCNYENPEVIKKGLPKQCYHSWTVKGLYRLDLLTFKISGYDPAGKLLGIFVTSHLFEGYIDNMKIKLKCATTSELLLKTSQNKVKISVGDAFSLNKANSPSDLISGESAHSCVDVE